MMLVVRSAGLQGGFFTGPAQKVLSVEDCKVPNKKVKVFRSLLYIKRHQKNTQAKLFGKNSS